MLIKDATFSIDAHKKQLVQQEANALKDAKLRGHVLLGNLWQWLKWKISGEGTHHYRHF